MKAGSFLTHLAIFVLALISFLLLYIFVFPLTAAAPSINISSFVLRKNVPENNEVRAVLLREVVLGKNSIFVEVASVDKERSVGLSGRKSLPENRGMIFVFSEKTRPSFWMKGVLFPLDIIWISEGRIIGFNENVSPEMGIEETKLKIYTAPEPVDLVLEVNAGFIADRGISVGDEVIVK